MSDLKLIEAFRLNSKIDFWERLLENFSKIHLNICLVENPAGRVEAAVATKVHQCRMDKEWDVTQVHMSLVPYTRHVTDQPLSCKISSLNVK